MKWFQHQARANRDTKLKKVLMKYGAEGYGLYWFCIEHICDTLEPRLTFELEHDSEILAYELRIDTLKVEEMMRYMVSLGLFEESEGVISCIKLASHLGDNLTRNPALKKIIQDAKGRDCDGDATGYVYFIQDCQQVKVGYSQNPWSRVKDLLPKHKDAILIGHFKGTVQEEKEAHRVLDSWRTNGEWFELPCGLINLINAGKINSLGELRSETDSLRSDPSLRLSQQEERRGDEKRGEKEVLSSPAKAADNTPTKKIIDLYHEILPDLPACKRLNPSRQQAIRRRHRDIMESDLENWAGYFRAVSQSNFLMGRIPGKDWRANIDFLLTEKATTGVLEGKYQ